MNIVIFGPPGAGKGTQSNLIVEKFKLHQLSTGELLRNEIQNKTKLGQEIKSIMDTGNLVSNEIVSDLIEKYISDTNYNNKIIALLGPTNTGKTHIAIEKMLGYESGIFGLPLRLRLKNLRAPFRSLL